jgi:predicted DNA-binding transcriptional regulator AlpA
MSNPYPLPETGFLRLPQIIGDRTANPPVPAIVPVARSTWWKWVRNGTAPAQVKIGPRASAWRVSDIKDFIASGVLEAR